MAKITVRKGNVLLDIEDDPVIVQRYQSQGYSLLDSRGRVIPKETGETKLKAELDALKAQNAQLLKENADLKAKLDALVADQADEPEETSNPVPVKKAVKKRSVKR